MQPQHTEEAFTPDAFYFSSGRKRKLSEEEIISQLPNFIALLVELFGIL